MARRELTDGGGRRLRIAVCRAPDMGKGVLDGVSIGATNATFNTYPGSHTVLLEKPGYLTDTRSFEATEGKTAEVSVGAA